MQYVVTNSQMKQAERRCAEEYLPYIRLMENAGTACAEEIIKLAPKGAYITILCGSGNNGGDGFVISAELAMHGISSAVVMVGGNPQTDTARHWFNRLHEAKILDFSQQREVCTEQILKSSVVIDCIYGTGFHGTLPEIAADALRLANQCPLRIAVDVPSGINSDTGEMDKSCFMPTHTLVLGAMKNGLLNLPCCDLIGEIKLLDIGIDDTCYGEEYIAQITDRSFSRPFPPRMRSSHKGSYGRLLNIAGSLCYNGAAVMSTRAALRTGVGLCTLAAPISAMKIAAGSVHECTYIPLPETDSGFVGGNAFERISEALQKSTAVSIGCGMGNSENTRTLTQAVIKAAACPIIIDADGINSIADNIDILKERQGEIILTPHVAEFSRISGLSITEIQRDRIGAAKAFSAEYGVTVVLKGANTVIAGADGSVFVNICGNTGLAKGGSGDVLTGIIASMVAQGISPVKAAASGVYCHARAADLLLTRFPEESMLPCDIIETLPMVYRS